MADNGNNSHTEEFHIIYVDTTPSGGRTVTPHSLSVGCAQRLSPKDYYMERREK